MNKNAKTWLGIALVLVGVGAGIWFWEVRKQPVPPPEPVAEVKPVEVPAPPPQVSLAEGEELLKSLARELSAKVQPWLTETDLLRRLVAATQQVASGESPRTVLGFLAPQGEYAVVTEGKKKQRKFYPDPQGYARYDEVTATVTSIDPHRAADVYAKVKPFAEAAYAEIGRPGTTFDSALRKAIANLLAAPVPEGTPELKEKSGVIYEYADPKLEGLNAAQKHLLRMGPEHQRAVQEWLKQLEQALPPTS